MISSVNWSGNSHESHQKKTSVVTEMKHPCLLSLIMFIGFQWSIIQSVRCEPSVDLLCKMAENDIALSNFKAARETVLKALNLEKKNANPRYKRLVELLIELQPNDDLKQASRFEKEALAIEEIEQQNLKQQEKTEAHTAVLANEYQRIGSNLYRLRQYDKAVPLLTKAIGIYHHNPPFSQESARCNYFLGACYLNLKQFEQAEMCFGAAAQEASNASIVGERLLVEGQCLRSAILDTLGKHSEAQRSMALAISTFRNSAYQYQLSGDVSYELSMEAYNEEVDKQYAIAANLHDLEAALLRCLALKETEAALASLIADCDRATASSIQGDEKKSRCLIDAALTRFGKLSRTSKQGIVDDLALQLGIAAENAADRKRYALAAYFSGCAASVYQYVPGKTKERLDCLHEQAEYKKKLEH